MSAVSTLTESQEPNVAGTLELSGKELEPELPAVKNELAATCNPSAFPNYIGSLTSSQSDALAAFKKQASEAGLYTPASSSSKASHTDTTLVRFLRARKFDPTAAQKQFSEAEAWRKQHDVENLYKNFPVAELEESKTFYPTFIGRRDNTGLPIYVYRLSALDSKAQKKLHAVPEDRRYQRIVALYEYMFEGILNLCAAVAPPAASVPSSSASSSASPSTVPSRAREQISSVVSIIDLGGVSLSTLWGVRGHLQQSSTLATANYPETLGKIFVVNAPGFFPTVWGWVKGWFDANTRSKIQILGNPLKDEKALATLKETIAPENLPKSYGGELAWETGDAPALDPALSAWLKRYNTKKDENGVGNTVLRGVVIIDPLAGDDAEATKQGN